MRLSRAVNEVSISDGSVEEGGLAGKYISLKPTVIGEGFTTSV